MAQNEIVQKLWNLCHILRDSGINYPDYVTELALLLFIKIESANYESGLLNKHRLPSHTRWSSLISKRKNTDELFNHYTKILADLGQSSDPVIYAIYHGATTNLQNPKHLKDLIDTLEEIKAFGNDKDDLGDLYEGLLEKTAAEAMTELSKAMPELDSLMRALGAEDEADAQRDALFSALNSENKK